MHLCRYACITSIKMDFRCFFFVRGFRFIFVFVFYHTVCTVYGTFCFIFWIFVLSTFKRLLLHTYFVVLPERIVPFIHKCSMVNEHEKKKIKIATRSNAQKWIKSGDKLHAVHSCTIEFWRRDIEVLYHMNMDVNKKDWIKLKKIVEVKKKKNPVANWQSMN